MSFIAETPQPPYYAVIFTSVRTGGDSGYAETAERILALARQQPSFLGFESARDAGEGISVSYWASLEAIKAWRDHPEHRQAQAKATQWYASCRIRICRVERDY